MQLFPPDLCIIRALSLKMPSHLSLTHGNVLPARVLHQSERLGEEGFYDGKRLGLSGVRLLPRMSPDCPRNDSENMRAAPFMGSKNSHPAAC